MEDGNEPKCVCAGGGVTESQKMGPYFQAALGSDRKGESIEACVLYKAARNVPMPHVYFFLKQCQIWLKENSQVAQEFQLP